MVVYGDGAKRGREEESGDVPEDQQLTRSTWSSTARRGEVGDDVMLAGRRRLDGGQRRREMDGGDDSSEPASIPSA